MSTEKLPQCIVAALLCLVFLGCSDGRHQRATAPRIAEETLITAKSCGFDYTKQMDEALKGDEGAIRELFLFSSRTDAAGSIGHGVALVELFRVIGEESPARIAKTLKSDEKQVLVRILEAGVAYAFKTGPEEFPKRFPQVFASLATIAAAGDPDIDLSKMPHLSPKGRIQDKDYNPDILLVDEMIGMGTNTIPFLISKLADETEVDHQVMCLWPVNTVGDIALVVLTDLVTDSSWRRQTIPGTSWEELLGQKKDPKIPSWQYVHEYVEKHGRRSLQAKWQKIWTEHHDHIGWDEKQRCFKIDPAHRRETKTIDELVRLQRVMEAAKSQSAMNEASMELAKYWDRVLQQEEEKILASSDAGTGKLFKETQKSWRQFRQTEVDFQGDASRGGSVQPFIHNATYANLTEQRVRDLRLYSQKERNQIPGVNHRQ